jgi:uncharacterized protein (TIGR03084 family)
MEEVVAALAAQQDELAGFVAGAGAEDLSLPSRCPGWSVADVLLHLAQTNEMAVASLEGRLDAWSIQYANVVPPGAGIDELAGALVDFERGAPEASRDRWAVSADAQLAAFGTVARAERVRWVAGDLAARTLATTRLTESWIHTVDAAVAFGPEPPPTDRLWHTARLVWRTVPYALSTGSHEASGPIGFELVAPDGSTWSFGAEEAVNDERGTMVRGTAHDLCTVAGQRADAADTSLTATGPDAEAVLRLMRSFA